MNLSLLPLVLPVLAAAPLGPPPPAPVVHLRVLPPAGSRVVVHPGTPLAVGLAAPALAVRPGYVYRLGLENLPDDPTRPVYPSLEVHGTLSPCKGLDIRKFPVPVTIRDEDILNVRKGALVTKVFFLENPELAVPVAATPDSPVELDAPSLEQAIRDARERGRLLMVLRIGGRSFSDMELAQTYIPGTVLLPNEPILPPAAAPPPLDVRTYGITFDPIAGPRCDEFECFIDGGDKKLRLGFDPQDRLSGLDATDTAMEFRLNGVKRVTTSNKVCVCIPRFAALTVVALPGGIDQVKLPAAQIQPWRLERLDIRAKPGELDARHAPQSVQAFQAPRALIRLLGPAAVETITGINVIVDVKGPKVVTKVVGPEAFTSFDDCCLALTKWVAPPLPEKIGDTVTFYLRYKNLTMEPIEDVTISDSLSGRLAYIDGSAKTDRGANFTRSENEVGSTVLRWQIPGKLLPGQTGIVSFRATIR